MGTHGLPKISVGKVPIDTHRLTLYLSIRVSMGARGLGI